MIPLDRVAHRARQWFSCGGDDPARRVGIWLCATALGEPALGEPALPGPAPAVVTEPPSDLLRADPVLLLSLADQITGRTAFGTRTDQIPVEARRWWTTLLPPAMTLAVRAHDVALTSALLLAGTWLGCSEHPLLRDAAAFLAAQQQPDGGFGGSCYKTDPSLQDTVRVPLTLGCVWALTEVEGTQRLTTVRPLLAAHGPGAAVAAQLINGFPLVPPIRKST